ncbi:hypothetical protein [Microvirga alba]|uniref:Uncharacterized protein n=1 Tax=Microvirga alba TaxID=2791025 RepID=A0A931FRA3_9HYPH|nr:hypothetical protein [Microvirga alba]MBF9234323.1 hypothetical protein [Microvirga alba]
MTDHVSTAQLRSLKRILNAPLLVLAVIVVLIDDAFRALVVPAVRALSRLALFRRIETTIAGLPAHVILLLFIIPIAILEPFKLYALYLFSQGKLVAGVLTFVIAKVVGLGLAERLFAIGRDKLLSIGWFARCHAKVLALRDFVHGWLISTRLWQQALQVVRIVLHIAARGRTKLAALLRATDRGGRFAAARRRVRRYWAV